MPPAHEGKEIIIIRLQEAACVYLLRLMLLDRGVVEARRAGTKGGAKAKPAYAVKCPETGPPFEIYC
jgi:hypothetical protein